MYAYTGVLTHLYHREKTGKGAAFEVSMLEAMGEFMGFPLYFSNFGERALLPRTGSAHSAIFPYGPFKVGKKNCDAATGKAQESKQVFFGIQNEREFRSFCEKLLGRPDLPDD